MSRTQIDERMVVISTLRLVVIGTIVFIFPYNYSTMDIGFFF